MSKKKSRAKRKEKGSPVLLVFFLCALGVALGVGVAVHSGRLDPGVITAQWLSHLGGQFPKVKTDFGELRIKTTPEGRGLSVRVSCSPCTFRHAQLGPSPLQLREAVLEGKYEGFRFRGTVRSGSVAAQLDTSWRKGEATGKVVLPQTSLAQLYTLLKPIVPEVKTARISGTVSGQGNFSWPGLLVSFRPKLKNFAVQGLIDERHYQSGTFRYQVRDNRNRPVTRMSGEGTSDWLPLNEAGRLLPDAVTVAEDGAFWSHPGYDIPSMLEASAANKKAGTLRRGGSTITQQLAKNLFLNHDRTYSRKLRELLYAVELERELGKRRILELYLNIVEWGPGVYGALAASRLYFNKHPFELEAQEAAWLASILRGPKSGYTQQFRARKPRRWKVDWILQRMKQLNGASRQAALQAPIRFADHTQ